MQLSYPRRLDNLSDIFGRSAGWLSNIFNDMLLYLQKRYHRMLRWHPGLLNIDRILSYAQAINELDSGCDSIWGFIDGTFIGFCRPGVRQRTVYSGYKYQVIVTPDGLCLSIDGPFEGKANELTMVKESKLGERLQEVSIVSGEALAGLLIEG